jgi:hypothetical protein
MSFLVYKVQNTNYSSFVSFWGGAASYTTKECDKNKHFVICLKM